MKFEISEMVCPSCESFFPIPRKKSARREYGHIKDLYCPFCKKIKHMKEIRPNAGYRNLAGDLLNVV